MLTRPQQILLKRAQAQARVDDAEYRDTLERFCGVRSSTDHRMCDEHLDGVLAYLEGVYWHEHDAGRLPAPCNTREPFVQRGYWKNKNQRGNTSRDRYTVDTLNEDIATLERALTQEFGLGLAYFRAIQNRVIPTAGVSRTWPAGLVKYKLALERTLQAKRRKAQHPF